MTLPVEHSIDYLAWARRANGRWIVHGGLSKDADEYMVHLERSDLPRLTASCRNAYLMVWQRDSMEDPKPWFYAGLFSLATAEEAEKFTANHWMTHSLISPCPRPAKDVGQSTLEKIQRLREAMARLPD